MNFLCVVILWFKTAIGFMWYQSFSSGDLLKHGPIPFLHTIVSSWTPLSYMPISVTACSMQKNRSRRVGYHLLVLHLLLTIQELFINESRNNCKEISTDLRKSVKDHFTILACCHFWNHLMMREILFLLCKIFAFFRRNASG